MKDDTVSRASVLKAIDEYERLSAVSQTVRNMTSLREMVQCLPSVQTCEDAVSRQQAIDAVLRAEALVRAYGYRYAADAVRELPSAQPQEIIRCKDCKYWMRENISDGYCSEMNMGDCDEDFYCGYAVRKENRWQKYMINSLSNWQRS